MKAHKFFAIMLTVLALSACKDELESGGGVVGKPGYLTFDLSERNGWTEDNITRSGVEAPILMEMTLEGAPLYLHTSVQPSGSAELQEEIDCSEEGQPETRGIRYTEDVFSLTSGGSPKISDFGVYGRTQDGSLTLFNFAQITPTTTATKDGVVYYDWNVKEDATMFQAWGSGLADFYGYAPYFANPSTANGLSMAVNSQGVPVLTYEVPADVTEQLDILTAKQTGVAKSSNGTVVKLPFDHVMSAIKFQFGKGDNNNYTWSDGVSTYNITVDAIHINNVYSKGTWKVGDDPYTSSPTTEGRWTIDSNDPGTASFTYSLTKSLQGLTASTTELNPDDEGNVFMMLPQTVPADATISLDCTLTSTNTSGITKTATLTASLKTWEGNNKTTTPMTWLPGYTYVYTVSMSDIAYVFDYNTATAKNYTNAAYDGQTLEEGIFIRSYKIDSKGTKKNVDWEIQHEETDADVTGVGQGGGGDQTTWKTGTNGWIHLYDKTGGTYANANEVTSTHVGANEDNTDNEKLFKIAVETIMVPIYDLSMWNQYQTKRWKGRSTSNCYIVAGPGTYRIPLIYGNAWTKGAVNTVAFNSGLSIQGDNNILGAFKNAYDEDITSPFIKKDIEHYGHSVKDAVLIWEEGDIAINGLLPQTEYENTRHSMGGGTGGNEGTVVKVISTIDTAITGEDTYNANNTTAGTQTGCDYLQFEVKYSTFNYGNAVVGIRDENNNIVWSWHIWMVNPDDFIKNNVTLSLDGNSVTYASTNIGWVNGGNTVQAETRTGKERLVQAESGKIITIDATQQKRRQFSTYFTNVLYQWGRKDPIRGNVDAADMNYDYGAPRGEAGVTSYGKANFHNTPINENGILIYGEKKSIGEMIQTPNTAWGLSDGDLYSHVYYNLWASKLKKVYNTNGGTWLFYGKTIYDPSPVGYCVPPSKFLTKLSRSGFAEIGASVSLPIVCYYNGTLPFHASGIRTTTAGYDLTARGYHQPEALNAANGFYHTATPYSHDECWQLHLYFYSGTDTHNFIRGDMCEALSVKPVLWNGEAVETEELDEDKEYLTFTFLEAGKFYWVDAHITQTSRTIQWTRTPNDENSWQNVTSSYDGAGEDLSDTHEGTKIAEVSSGDKIYVRGTNATYCIKSAGTYYYNFFRSTGAYELSGNIMSLTWGSDFIGKTTFQSGSTFTFCSLFYNPNLGHHNRSLESVDGLVLPATTLVQSCYESMFEGCEDLIASPYLPATVGATDCYKNMYKNCSALTMVESALLAPSSNYTSGWVNGVASTGTFFYNRNATTWPTGDDGIPSGWASYPIY